MISRADYYTREFAPLPPEAVRKPEITALALAVVELSKRAQALRCEADRLAHAEHEYTAHTLHIDASQLDQVVQWLRAQQWPET